MSKLGIIYHSKTGNTEKMANHVFKGVNDIGSEIEGVLKPVEETETADLLDWQGIIVVHQLITACPPLRSKSYSTGWWNTTASWTVKSAERLARLRTGRR